MTTSLRLLRSEADYEAALRVYEAYFDKEPEVGTEEGDRFVMLGMLIAKYEDERWPAEGVEPVAVIKTVMETNGYTRKDLAAVLGSSPRATEVLKGKRDLTLENIRRLRRAWHIPADALIGDAAPKPG